VLTIFIAAFSIYRIIHSPFGQVSAIRENEPRAISLYDADRQAARVRPFGDAGGLAGATAIVFQPSLTDVTGRCRAKSC
jgi:ABC-type branched-subunit amino acid transport system permease subunit